MSVAFINASIGTARWGHCHPLPTLLIMEMLVQTVILMLLLLQAAQELGASRGEVASVTGAALATGSGSHNTT